jgi:hypothetical protein
MMNQPVAEIHPLLPGNQLHEIALDLLRGAAYSQSQPARYPLNVGVDNDARGDPECRAQDDIRRLAADSRQRRECLDFFRDSAMVLFNDTASECQQIPSLGSEKPRGTDEMLQFGWLSPRKTGRVREPAKQLRRHHVDTNIRTLGGQYCCDQELVGVSVRERTDRIRVGAFQRANNLERVAPKLFAGNPRISHTQLRETRLSGHAERPGSFFVTLGTPTDQVDFQCGIRPAV